jgi:signal transduction histidine kinase/ActR/RegA family two-component response regulator
MTYNNIINKASIKSKTYLLVLLTVFVALVLSFVSNNGLNAIRIEQDNLTLSTEIERYTNKLIHEEQKYRLNANGSVNNFTVANQSYDNAITHVDKIYQIINEVNSLDENGFLLENLQKTRHSTDEYKNLYMKGVSLLTELNKQATILEFEGASITQQIQEYVESKRTEIKQDLSQKTIEKINNGSNIWQYTYVTRLHEKTYRLSPDNLVFNAFNDDYQFMMTEWNRLKKMSDQPFEFEKLDTFKSSSQKYEAAMLLWFDLNKQLVTEVLPKMQKLGNSIISSAIQSANLSVKQMSDKRNNIALSVIIVSVTTIVLGIIFGAIIARSISSPLEKLKKQALAISDGKYETQIKVSSNDEIGKLAEAFNFMASTIAKEMTGRKMAEDAQRRSQKMDAIGQLTGGIAHDFNNLLCIILGNLELLEMYVSQDKKTHKRIKVIEKAGMRAAKLTKQLLSFSRREAKEVSTVNVNRVISEMTEIIKRSLTPEIEVKYILSEDLWVTEIDAGDFEDTLLNLCINARDSMAGHGKLTIETHNANIDEDDCKQNVGLNPGQYIELIVSDNGEGIPKDLREKIFEPFFTTKDQGKGTGLGLAMVYAFVKRSNGYIKYDSKMGVGTSFHIYLPKENGEEDRIRQNDKQSESIPHGKETILVVDDEEALMEMAKVMLEAQGYRVLTAGDGRQALVQLAQDSTIDLLFSDIVMPNGMSGYELAEQATANRQDLKVLFASGFSEKAESHNDQKRFSAKRLNKPYSQMALAREIRATLDEPKTQ